MAAIFYFSTNKKWNNDSLFYNLQDKAYEEELKRCTDKEQAALDKARLKAQEAVSHSCDNKNH